MKYIITLLGIFAFICHVSCLCYFPVEYQGEFATQSSMYKGGAHKYSQITILPDGIPLWGVCHKKMGNSVILKDRTGTLNCIRCFHISLHSPNVIQVYTEGVDKCYTTEEKAMSTCPTMVDITSGQAREIMLYKSRSFTLDGVVDRVHCPFSGNFHFTYNVNDGTETSDECPQKTSQISNCPLASELNLRFRRCSFGKLEMSLRCLGDWTGYDGEKYLALWDPRVTGDQPRYRCAMYHHDSSRDITYLSFSADATCRNQLHSPWDGYETMVLSPYPAAPEPATARAHQCVFPQWAQGQWQNLKVSGREIRYTDEEHDKTFTTLCLSQHAPHGERYALYSKSQCGDEDFTCIWIKKRDVNVIEFQIAAFTSPEYNASQICADEVFVGQKWMTQGKISPENLAGCPVMGQYTGVIPDAQELCARLSSDCDDPQHMHYTVTACYNSTEVYEDQRTWNDDPNHLVSRNKRGIYKITNPRALLRHHSRNNNRNTRHEDHRHFQDTPQLPDWDAEEFKLEFDQLKAMDSIRSFPTVSSPSRKTHSRKPPQVYVFPNLEESTIGSTTSSYQNNWRTTTRRPYAHERPFYYIDNSDEETNEIVIPNNQVVEEREYICLGQWVERGIRYTFTHRRDVDTYECFAGIVVSPTEVYIIEAGESCKRGLQPLMYGMKLTKEASCDDVKPQSVDEVHIDPNDPQHPLWTTNKSNNPWYKKTTSTTPKPRWKNEKTNSSPERSRNIICNILLLLFLFLHKCIF